MDRVLVTGASGLLGSNASLALAQTHTVIPSARRAPLGSVDGFVAADIGDALERAKLLRITKPTVVLHAAAISSIEACRENPELAHRINVEASIDLAKIARDAGAVFVFISTDAVFDGDRGNYKEDDDVSPTTEYGITKVKAERGVLEVNPDAIVARVNFYGWSPTGSRSLAEFFHSSLQAGRPVNGFTDTRVSTMYVASLIEALGELVAAQASGVVHVASPEPTTKFDLGKRLATAFGFDGTLVHAARSSDHLQDNRGAHMELLTDRYTLLTGKQLPSQAADVQRLFEDRVGRRAAVTAYSPV